MSGFVEGDATVPGGTLHYKLAGPSSGPCVVFENGWSASFPYAHRLERALAQHVRVLSYDRAGIGESRRDARPAPPDFTKQLIALLAQLKIETPVVIAGHSYGGIMAAVHAAQAPQAVSKIVQIDATPENDFPRIDKMLHSLAKVARVSQALLRFGLPEPLFAAIGNELEGEQKERVLRAMRKPSSISAAIDELKQLTQLREVIAKGPQCPRLVVSAATVRPRESRIQKFFGGRAAALQTVADMQVMHQRTAKLHAQSRWESLPYDHGELVIDEAGARAVAARIRDFLHA